MMTLSPEDLRKRLEIELKKIGGDNRLLPEINNSNGYAKPFIEIDRYGYSYVCRERGEEIFRKLPIDIDQLLFEVFDDVTCEMATSWEVKNRRENEDTRLRRFAKQVDLIKTLGNELIIDCKEF